MLGMVQRALVLAGGGVAGVAWELGVLLGIRDGAPDLLPRVEDVELIVGTSAGSTVAAQNATGVDLQELFDRQLTPTSSEIEIDFDIDAMMAMFGAAYAESTSPEDMRRRIGALALAADTVPEDARRQAIAGRLPVQEWSDRVVLIPAVDAETGELVVFTRDSGVPLLDAVTASCAVPGVWPPTTINGRRYIDGGTRSSTNADLAGAAGRVLVIVPALIDVEPFASQFAQEVSALEPARVFTVSADDAALQAFGANPLSPATRRPAALAGRTLGSAVARQVEAFWG
jgi:NTE family protein